MYALRWFAAWCGRPGGRRAVACTLRTLHSTRPRASPLLFSARLQASLLCVSIPLLWQGRRSPGQCWLVISICIHALLQDKLPPPKLIEVRKVKLDETSQWVFNALFRSAQSILQFAMLVLPC